MARQRPTYVTIEQHRRKGKQGQDLKDPEVKGLYYHKQGTAVYARYRVMNKATKKRDTHYWEGSLPTSKDLMEQVNGAPIPPGPRARDPEWKEYNDWYVDTYKVALDQGEKLLERIRSWARQKRRQAKGLELSGPDEAPTQRTVAELVAAYEAVAFPKLSAKTVQNHRSYLRRFILPTFGARVVTNMKRQDVEELHASLAPTPYQANRVLSLLSTILGKAVEWGWRPDNPAAGVKLYDEHPREDWYTAEELAKLIATLETFAAGDDKARKVSARAILLTLLTGARPSEVLRATWDMFDLQAGTWTKPSSHVKQKRIYHLALNEDALELLRTMREELGGKAKGYVFPSPFVPGQHLKDPGRTWERAVEVAGVRRLRFYDLRHSQGSVLANAGVDLYTVGKQLGHAQTKTTARYAHLSVETQRSATDRFSELVKVKRG
jgi:integrase